MCKFILPKNGATVEAEPLRNAVRKVLPFCPDPSVPIISTGPDGVSTLDGAMSASLNYKGLPSSRWNANLLLTALDAASTIELDTYPSPCYWQGKNIDGIIAGVR